MSRTETSVVFGTRTGRPVLLTGAGFSHNFGAPLADQLWARAFNHCSHEERLRQELLACHNFEDVYGKVMLGDFTPAEKSAMSRAVTTIYGEIDETIANYGVSSSRAVDSRGFHALINSFAGQSKTERGFIFTLNQDMLFERWYHDDTSAVRFYQPGVGQVVGIVRDNPHRTLPPESQCTLPKDPNLVQSLRRDLLEGQQRLYLMKLHGSQNWLSSDGRQLMVLGTQKSEQIEKEPVLRHYSAMFAEVLGAGGVKLLVSGYSFGDGHVNDVIGESIGVHGLKLYVLSPQSPAGWSEEVKRKPRGDQIVGGLHGYFEAQLADLLPLNGGLTGVHRDLRRTLFG